jgi:hypothetical protein
LEPQFQPASAGFNEKIPIDLPDIVVTAPDPERVRAENMAANAQKQLIVSTLGVQGPANTATIRAYDMRDYRPDIAMSVQIANGVKTGLESEFIGIGISKGLSLANKGLASGYLKTIGEYKNFSSVHGFTFEMGGTTNIYHNTALAASRTRWSSPIEFSSSTYAVDALALDYAGSTNFAQLRFQSSNFGLFIKGTASSQGGAAGGGTQMYKTTLGFRSKPLLNQYK